MADTVAYSYVRMSTRKQLGGTSLQRQVEQSKKYAEERGWILDEVLTLHDLGVSGFKGQNVKKGELGKFLVACESGLIKRGSVLIVESLDRISRQDPLEAMMLLREILQHGVMISTFHDKQDYTIEKLKENPSSMFMSLGVLIRAFEESKTKSMRVADVWARRRNAGVKRAKVSGTCPHWLRPNIERTDYEVIEERAAIVRRIFKMMIDGYGYQAIVNKLNDEGVPTFNRKREVKHEGKNAHKDKAKGWRISYLQYLLKQRAVLGEWQPNKMIDGKRVPVGEPIKDYYPAILDVETYLKAKQAVAQRRRAPTTTGKKVKNPFRGLLRCTCGASIAFNKHAKHNYYICSERVNGLCTADYKQSIPMSTAQSNLFVAIAETSTDFFVASDSKYEKQQAMELEDNIKTAEAKIGEMLEMMFDSPSEQAADFIREKQSEVNDWKERLHKLKEQIQSEEVTNTQEALRELAEVIWSARFVMSPKEGEALLSQRLKNVIDKVVMDFNERTATIFFHGGQTKCVDVGKLSDKWAEIMSDYEDSLPDYITQNRSDADKNWLV